MNDNQIAALSGPNFATEIVKNIPTVSIVGSKSSSFAYLLSQVLSNEYFVVKPTSDVIGVEIGGAYKNLAAIAIGITDGLDLGENTRGLIFSYFFKEILFFGTRIFGADPETLHGYACLGDMITTSFSNKSRNRIIGLLASKCITNIPQNSFISEGKNTAHALMDLAIKNNINVPGAKFVYSVLNGENPMNAFNNLFSIIRNETVSKNW